MGQDEEQTHPTLVSHRKIFDSLIEQHHGRFVNSAGDSVLAEFASVVNAAQCAVEVQTALKRENDSLQPDRRMEFRIGVNLGDVMLDGDQALLRRWSQRRRAIRESRGAGRYLRLADRPRKNPEQARARLRRTSGNSRSRTLLNPYASSGCYWTGQYQPPSDTTHSTPILARRRSLLDRAGDYRRDNRAGTAYLAQDAANLRLDSAAREAGTAIAQTYLRSRCCRSPT